MSPFRRRRYGPATPDETARRYRAVAGSPRAATIDVSPRAEAGCSPTTSLHKVLVTLTLGSLDTLKSQLGWCFYHMATHPQDRRKLVDSPELVPSAVEEFLRAYPIVSMARKVTQDVDFHGCPMKKDDMVLLTIQAATRDPRQFPNPADVVIDRQPNRHIAFGVRLRIEKNLGMTHVLFVRLF